MYRNLRLLAIVRMASTFILALAFVGIFIDRVMRGVFDAYSFIFIGTTVLAFIVQEWAKERERFTESRIRQATEAKWNEFMEEQEAREHDLETDE